MSREDKCTLLYETDCPTILWFESKSSQLSSVLCYAIKYSYYSDILFKIAFYLLSFFKKGDPEVSDVLFNTNKRSGKYSSLVTLLFIY